MPEWTGRVLGLTLTLMDTSLNRVKSGYDA